MARHYALALTFITPTALTIVAGAGTISPADLVRERVVGTLLGAGIAFFTLLTTGWLNRIVTVHGENMRPSPSSVKGSTQARR